jgi:hypothetical protein
VVEGEAGSDAALGLLGLTLPPAFSGEWEMAFDNEGYEGGGSTLAECGREGGFCGPRIVNAGRGGVASACCMVSDCCWPSGTGVDTKAGGLGNGPGNGMLPENGRDGPWLSVSRRSGDPFGDA